MLHLELELKRCPQVSISHLKSPRRPLSATKSFDAAMGVFTWRPMEEQAPGTYSFDVAVRGDAGLSARGLITVTVDKDMAPVLEPPCRVDDVGLGLTPRGRRTCAC